MNILPTEMLRNYKLSIARLEKKELNLAHVGLYDDRVIIVLQDPNSTKKVVCIDNTRNPEQNNPVLKPKAEEPKPKRIKAKKAKPTKKVKKRRKRRKSKKST